MIRLLEPLLYFEPHDADDHLERQRFCMQKSRRPFAGFTRPEASFESLERQRLGVRPDVVFTSCEVHQHAPVQLEGGHRVTDARSRVYRNREDRSSELLEPLLDVHGEARDVPVNRAVCKYVVALLDPDSSTFLIPNMHLTGGIADGLGSLRAFTPLQTARYFHSFPWQKA